MISSSVDFFHRLLFTDEDIRKYREIEFSIEDSEKIEKILVAYDLDGGYNFEILTSICEAENYLLSNEIMYSLILYLVKNTDYSYTDILTKNITDNSFYNNEFKKQVLFTMQFERENHLDLEEVIRCCSEIYEEINDISLYKVLSEIISDELFDIIIKKFLSEPIEEMNYLIIYILQSRMKLEMFVEKYSSLNYDGVLFLVQACREISKTDNKFAYRITRQKILSKIDKNWDNLSLITNYLSLLFELLLDSNDEILSKEIECISDGFIEWRLDNIVYLLYRDGKKISTTCANSLYSLIIKKSKSDIKNLKYPINCIYSILDDDTFIEFMLPVLSLLGLENSREITSRIEKKMDISFKKIIVEAIESKKDCKIALELLKLLYSKKVISVSNFKERDLLKLLRMFHWFELDGIFVCNIAIDFLLNSSTQKDELFEYIISSIYDNYFYILDEKISGTIDSRLDKLKAELDQRKEVRDRARSNPDFKPSEKNMNIYYEKQAEMNRKISKEAEKQSVFLNIISRQTILYGHKVEYSHFDDTGKLHTEISKMTEMSHSMPIPVRFINDPIFRQYELSLIMEDESND